LLDGDGPLSLESGEEMPHAEFVSAVVRYAPVVEFCLDWESGRFHLSLAEYRQLPEIVLTARRLINAKRTEIRNRQAQNG
jgi:hypothetical protein